MEKMLHEIYNEFRINGEWFEFDKKQVSKVFENIPAETLIYPTGDTHLIFSRFSNIEEDLQNSKKIVGVKVQKLRGNFTSEEREARKIASIEQQKKKKEQKLLALHVNDEFAV